MPSNFPDPAFRIVVFTSPDDVPGEKEKITTLLRAGADLIHLRKPGISHEDMLRLATSFPPSCTIHPGRSRGCHSLPELSAPAPDIDYQFLSPIFDSISKVGYKSNFDIVSDEGEKRIPDAIAEATAPVFALGGVTVDKIPLLTDTGFDGAAFLGHVWNSRLGYESLLRYLRLRNGRFQFITDGVSPEETARQAIAAIDGGCRWIQVRMKDAPLDQIRYAVRLIRPNPDDTRPFTLIVDDHAVLLDMPEVDGVHLGQDDISPAEARKYGDKSKIIGLTVNRPDQLIGKEYADVDYYGIGPFRHTGTKKRLAPILGLDGYLTINTEMDRLSDSRPYVAIGGIIPSDIPVIKAAGIPGIAVSGAIAHSPDPISATRHLSVNL